MKKDRTDDWVCHMPFTLKYGRFRTQSVCLEDYLKETLDLHGPRISQIQSSTSGHNSKHDDNSYHYPLSTVHQGKNRLL